MNYEYFKVLSLSAEALNKSKITQVFKGKVKWYNEE